MKKSKFKSFLCIFAICLILFTFLSVPVSASGLANDIGSTTFEAPVSFNFYYSFYDYEQTDINLAYPRLYYSYSPVLSTNYTDSSDKYVEDLTTFVGDYPFIVTMFSDPRSHGDNVYGDFIVDLGGPNVRLTEFTESLYLTDFYFTIEDFYCWNYDFDFNDIDFPTLGSEISFSYFNNDSDFFIQSYRIDYSVAGSDVIQDLTISRNDGSSYGADLSTGLVNISPYMFDVEATDVVYYIHQVKFFLNSVPQNPWSVDWKHNFTVSYVNNPYLDNLVLDNGSDPTPPSDNPALALIPYTVWLGEAVSGFMDFQLFSGFTIGGIFMTILAFACVIWFLKLVAGG